MMKDEEFAPYNFPIEDKTKKVIKVIGVGGGGGNAVHHMLDEKVKDVTFVVVNTDSQVLKANKVPNKIQLGDGLGTGGNPELGREIAEKCIEEINSIFDDDTEMVFIMAGMGGGTGTGVAPVIARAAKERGILTVGVVTLPFKMEGRRRIEKALVGMNELKKHVDSWIVINNERLLENEQYAELTWEDGMKMADEVLTVATRTISEIITEHGKINRDLRDVCTVMQDGGAAVVSLAKAKGEKRIFKAMSEALNFPLVSNMNKQKIKRLLYIVYSGDKAPAMMSELQEINDFMEEMNENVEVLWGHYHDSTLEDEIKVSLIATGFDPDEIEEGVRNDDAQKYKRLYEKYYNGGVAGAKAASELGKDAEIEAASMDEGEDEEEEGYSDEIEPHFILTLIQKLKRFTEE